MNEWWNNLSRRAQLIWCTVVGLVIAVLTAGIIWWNSPNQQISRSDYAQKVQLINGKIRTAPTADQLRPLGNGKFAYHGKTFDYHGGTATDTPDLATLLRLQKEGRRKVYRCGQVSIPSYGIDVPIYEGTSPYTLAWGAGTAKPGQAMGQGNYALEAHNYIKKLDGVANYAINGWFFSKLQTRVAPYGAPTSPQKYDYFRVPVGTNVYTLGAHNVYTYQVIKHVVVPNAYAPGAGQILADSAVQHFGDGKTPLLTLATCYIQNGITYPKARLVYVCKLVKTTPRDQFDKLDKVFLRF